MRVAVTGGSGVIGRAVVGQLVANGFHVRALARSETAAGVVEGLGATPVIGDLSSAAGLRDLVRNTEWVFNVAGVNELCSRDPSHLWKTNVDGALSVLEACSREGVRRLIHTSSAATTGEPKGTVGTEETKHRGFFLSEYERSKTVSEQMLRDSDSRVEVVFVNPSSVQGPGRSTGSGRFMVAAAAGRAVFAVDAPISIVDIRDCATAHLLAAERGEPGIRHLVSGSTTTVRDVLSKVRRLSPRGRRTLFVRPEVARAVAPVIAAVAPGSGVCEESMEVLLAGHRYDGSAAAARLGFSYTGLDETLRSTVEWFQSVGLV